MTKRTAKRRIRELWPLVLTLRREGMSWRKLPAHMNRYFGVPVVSHVSYIAVAHEFGDVPRQGPEG